MSKKAIVDIADAMDVVDTDDMEDVTEVTDLIGAEIIGLTIGGHTTRHIIIPILIGCKGKCQNYFNLSKSCKLKY